MATIKRFEDLETWKNARIFVKTIYTVTTEEAINRDYSYRDQIRRAAISIMNNIAEGFGRYSNKEFRRFLDIAVASGLEVKSMIYLGEDLSYMTKEIKNDLVEQNEKLHYQLLAFIKYLRSTDTAK